MQKLEIHDLIESLGLPHTYIDVGWWMQLYLPVPAPSRLPPARRATFNTLYGPGTHANLLTDRRHIGRWVARAVADPRTLGRKVVVWDDERPVSAAHAAGERLSGEPAAMRALRRTVRPPSCSPAPSPLPCGR